MSESNFFIEDEDGFSPSELKSLTIKPNSQKCGGYDITGLNGGSGSIMFLYPKKPNFFHRACCRFFLGWKWIDKK